jgi:hypothetical protein
MLILAGCIQDCFGYGELESSEYVGGVSAILDAAHPIAEQRITVRLNAAALPAGVATKTTLVIGPPATHTQPVPSLGPTQLPTTPPALVPEVTIIRDETNTVVPTTVSWSSRTAQYAPVFASIPIDCPPAKACVQAYRIRVAMPSLADGEQASVSWDAEAKITWTGATGTCGRPAGASLTIDRADPELVAAETSAFAAPAAIEEDGASLIGRHVIVTSDGPVPSAASMRISTLQHRTGEPSERNPEWRQWIRVIPDNVTNPAADALVGEEPYSMDTLRGGTLDVPILGDCVPREPCRRGYWVVFQNFPAVPPRQGAPAATVGRFAWTATAMTTYARGGPAPPATLTLRVDTLDNPLPPEPTVTEAAAPVTLVTNKVSTALDVAITVPERPQPENGIDRLAASAAIVNFVGNGDGLVTEVRGDGAGPIIGHANGDGRANLIAHPFAACPGTGPCTATFQLVGTFHVERTGSQADTATVSWGVQLLGAPPGTTVTFGRPHELPHPTEPSAGFAILAGLALVLAALVVIRWTRRRPRRATVTRGG